MKESTEVYYDSLKKNNGRPFSEYPDLRNLGEIEIHEPDVWQVEVECECMVILRYWQLFQGKQYIVNGKKARDQVLKYYNRDNNEGQKKQIRSRTALTRIGSFSRTFGSTFMKRLQ